MTKMKENKNFAHELFLTRKLTRLRYILNERERLIHPKHKMSGLTFYLSPSVVYSTMVHCIEPGGQVYTEDPSEHLTHEESYYLETLPIVEQYTYTSV